MPGEIHTRVNNTVTAMLPDDDKKMTDPQYYAVTTSEHAYELQKVYIVVDYDEFDETKSSELLDQLRLQQDRVFTIVKVNHATVETVQFDPTMPIMAYCRDGDVMQRLIDTGKVNIANVYNPPGDRSISSSKVEFHKAFEGADWLPKTVYEKDDASSLEFPVIAKPEYGRGGIGIEKFESHEELTEDEAEYGIYSECIDLENEYRAFCFKGKIVLINERVPESGEDGLDSRTKNSKGELKINFVYDDVDMKKFEQLDQAETIVKSIRDKVDLDVMAVDFMLDKEGKLWVAEINSRPGMQIEKMALLYTCIYEDWYKRPISDSTQKKLDELIEEYKKLKEKAEATRKLEAAQGANEGLRHVLTFESFVAKHYGRS